MPRATAALATPPPIAPRPITPRVRPGSSKPTNCFLPFSTALLISSSVPSRLRANDAPWPMLRAPMSIPASTSSFTALALAPGVLKTTMPFLAISATGMLFVPAPARATATTDEGTSMSCMTNERTR